MSVGTTLIDRVAILAAPPLRRLVTLALQAIPGVTIVTWPNADRLSLVVADWEQHSAEANATGADVLALVHSPGITAKRDAIVAGCVDVARIPFDLTELAVRAAVAIAGGGSALPVLSTRLTVDGLSIDLDSDEISFDGRAVRLTPLERRLMIVLVANRGDVLTRDEILEIAWGSEVPANSNLVDRHVRDLRRKLQDDWKWPLYIETTRGRGYSFRIPSENMTRPAQGGRRARMRIETALGEVQE